MWKANESYVESKARTNRLWCSACNKKITIGSSVIFRLNTLTNRMKDVFCFTCGQEFSYEITCDSRHPYDLEE